MLGRPQTEASAPRRRPRRDRAARPRVPRRPARRPVERAPGRARLAAPLRLTVLQGTRDAVASRPRRLRGGGRRARAHRPGDAAPRRPVPPAPGDPAAGARRRGAGELQGRRRQGRRDHRPVRAQGDRQGSADRRPRKGRSRPERSATLPSSVARSSSGPDGEIAWSHMSNDAGDNASPEEIIDAVRDRGRVAFATCRPRAAAGPVRRHGVASARAADDPVSAGQTLVVLEAMKMEHEIAAGVDGTVQSVDVAVGDTVEEGQRLALVAPEATIAPAADAAMAPAAEATITPAAEATTRPRRRRHRTETRGAETSRDDLDAVNGPPRPDARRRPPRGRRQAPRSEPAHRPREPRRPDRPRQLRRVRTAHLSPPRNAGVRATG